MEFGDFCLLKMREKALKLSKDCAIRDGLTTRKGFRPATAEGKIIISVVTRKLSVAEALNYPLGLMR